MVAESLEAIFVSNIRDCVCLAIGRSEGVRSLVFENEDLNRFGCHAVM